MNIRKTTGKIFENLLKGLFSFLYYPLRSVFRNIAYPVAGQDRSNQGALFGDMSDTSRALIQTQDNQEIEVQHTIIDKNKPTILYCHGNAATLDDCQDIFADYSKAGNNVIAFDYRGYGKSSGSPSEKGLYKDAEAAIT